jgi:phage tail-like protein
MVMQNVEQRARTAASAAADAAASAAMQSLAGPPSPPSPPGGGGGGGGGGGAPAAAAAAGGGGGVAASGGSKPLLDDLFTAYKFWVEIESGLVAGFTECSGIQAEAEVMDWLEGGENTAVLKFPGRTKYANITLKHGFTDSTKLWDWFTKVLKGTPDRKPLTIIMFDTQGKRKRTWNFNRAFPVKWQGPALKSSGNEIAIETVEFAHEGLLGI